VALDVTGCPASVEAATHEQLASPVAVYNFQVADCHTYHVGEAGILVHNAEYTSHGLAQAKARRFQDSLVDDIRENPSHKVYQSGGRTVYAKKYNGYYGVVATNNAGKVIACVGGNTRSLPILNVVMKMIGNQGPCSTLPTECLAADGCFDVTLWPITARSSKGDTFGYDIGYSFVVGAGRWRGSRTSASIGSTRSVAGHARLPDSNGNSLGLWIWQRTTDRQEVTV
jgi:hypothetical protein